MAAPQNPLDQHDTVVLALPDAPPRVIAGPATNDPVLNDTVLNDTVLNDTVALPRPAGVAGPAAVGGPAGSPVPGSPIPGSPIPGSPVPGSATPTPPPPGSATPTPVTPTPPPPTGWQSVSQWRETLSQQAPTAWSQVPPFIPAAPPVLVMRNNAAVVGATLGSVSLFLALLPLIGIVAWVLAPIGLLTSGVGLVVGMTRKVGRVGALWGILTSGLALAVCTAWTALLLAL